MNADPLRERLLVALRHSPTFVLLMTLASIVLIGAVVLATLGAWVGTAVCVCAAWLIGTWAWRVGAV